MKKIISVVVAATALFMTTSVSAQEYVRFQSAKSAELKKMSKVRLKPVAVVNPNVNRRIVSKLQVK